MSADSVVLTNGLRGAALGPCSVPDRRARGPSRRRPRLEPRPQGLRAPDRRGRDRQRAVHGRRGPHRAAPERRRAPGDGARLARGRRAAGHADRRGLPRHRRLPHPDRSSTRRSRAALGGATLDEAAVGPARAHAPRLPRRRRLARAGLHGPAALRRRPPRRHLARHAAPPAAARRSPAPASGCRWPTASGRAFMVMERNDLPSSRASYDGDVAEPRVDVPARRRSASARSRRRPTSRTRPTRRRGRQRALEPGEPFALEAAFIGFGLTATATSRGSTTATSPAPRWRALRARRDVQLERHRRRRASRPAPRTTWTCATVQEVAPIAPPARRRDVHPRRRLAGDLRRLGARLARSTPSRAGTAARTRSSSRASRTPASRPSARRSRR